MQGTHNNGTNPLIREVVDLDSLFAERSLEPTPVKLGGKVYNVRTDLTTAEVNDFLKHWRSSDEGSDVAALAIIVGKRDAIALDKAFAKLPHEHQATASAQFLRATRALAQYVATDEELQERYGKAGESKAS